MALLVSSTTHCATHLSVMPRFHPRLPSYFCMDPMSLDPETMHSSNINLHRKLLTKELDDIVLDPQLPPLPKDLRAQFLAKIYGGGHHGHHHHHQQQQQRHNHHHHHHPALEGVAGAHRNATRGEEAESPVSVEYGYRGTDDYAMVLDLSTTSSVQSSGSVHSSHESDEGSDEGILLDDLEGSEEGDGHAGVGDEDGCGAREQKGEELAPSDPASSPSLGGSGGGGGNSGMGGGILCTICHKMYSNKGTLRVHYKTVHLREMHKCKVPGCNMMFSSVRSRNRHSQNPNLHKNSISFSGGVE